MDSTRIPLLRKVMEHVTAHPEEHNQRWWGIKRSCGTIHCIGGWALALSDADLIWEDGQVYGVGPVVGYSGLPVFGAAQDALGLTGDEAHWLFYAKDLDGVWAVVETITGGALLRSEVDPDD